MFYHSGSIALVHLLLERGNLFPERPHLFQDKSGVVEDLGPFFLRLFMVPGARHCRDMPGITPENPFAAVVRWVEDGVPPDTLGTALESRPICRYPKAAVYSGNGDPSDAASFECRTEVLQR